MLPYIVSSHRGLDCAGGVYVADLSGSGFEHWGAESSTRWRVPSCRFLGLNELASRPWNSKMLVRDVGGDVAEFEWDRGLCEGHPGVRSEGRIMWSVSIIRIFFRGQDGNSI